jgi:hypothetical protein
VLDGLELRATLRENPLGVVAYDGAEAFMLEPVEAVFYELVAATPDELLGLERAYFRLLRRAEDFRTIRN